MTKDITTISLDYMIIPKPFQTLLRLRCRICKKKASLIAARSKPMCEKCYEIINYEYKMTRGSLSPSEKKKNYLASLRERRQTNQELRRQKLTQLLMIRCRQTSLSSKVISTVLIVSKRILKCLDLKFKMFIYNYLFSCISFFHLIQSFFLWR